MGKQIELKALDGHQLSAYRADPSGSPKGGVVVIQEIFGLNKHIREVADGYAAEGYLAIAPALFDRKERGVELGYDEKDIAIGREIAFSLGWDSPQKDMEAAAAAASEAGKVGVVGYCWGGSLTYLCACRLPIAAASCYYGGQITKLLDEDPSAKPKIPTLLHFGTQDAGIPPEDVERIRAANPDVPLHMYEAGHGFNCDHRGSYDEASAKLARARTLDLSRLSSEVHGITAGRAPAPYAAVIFDCDGVLVDTEVLANRVWVEMAAELGYALDAAEALRAFKGAQLARCIGWLEARMGREVPPTFAADFRARSAMLFERELRPVAGVEAVLASIALPIAVASNGPRAKMEVSLGVTGLKHHFDGRIYSAYDYRVWKPDPGLYLAAAAGLGVEPARCAVIEDSVPGIVAGVAAGMTVFAYSDPHERAPHARHGARVFGDMRELPGLLAADRAGESAVKETSR